VFCVQVMGAKDPSQYMYFACPNNKCWLGPYPKEAWGKAPIKRCNCKTAEDDLGLPFFVEVPVTNGRTDWEPAGRVRAYNPSAVGGVMLFDGLGECSQISQTSACSILWAAVCTHCCILYNMCATYSPTPGVVHLCIKNHLCLLPCYCV
jgi:hypothetical protein